jgi:Fe2+ or Zn2+ uptake regulation protein
MQTVREGAVVFDPNVGRHHHFVDDDTGVVYDIPWDQFDVKGIEKLKDFEVSEFQVIVRGKRKKK